MGYEPSNLFNMVSRDSILGNTSVEEQIEFISEQIKDPFDSGDNNYFKKLKKMVKTQDEMDEICVTLFNQMEDIYPNLEFDLSEYNQRLAPVFMPLYKFFTKNIDKLVFLFLKQYIFNNKNRKNIVSDYMNVKLPNYPKEQYGKKDFYILITKLSPIVKSIGKDGEVTLLEFIEFIERDEKSPIYLEHVKGYIEQGLFYDHGVVEDIFKVFWDSDRRDGIMNKLEMVITQSLIIPYLQENGMMEVRQIPMDPMDDEEDDDDEDGEDEDSEEV